MLPKLNLGRLIRGQWPYVCGVLTLPLVALFVLAATLVTTGYSHTTDTISELGGEHRPHSWVINTGVFLGGLLVLAFAYGLALQFGKSIQGKLLVTLLVSNATAAIFFAVFQVAWGESQLDASILGGSVHEIAARVSFTSLTIAIILFPAVIWRRPEWRIMRWFLQTLSISAVIFGILFLFEAFPDYSGVVQRSYFVMCGLWLEMVALQLLRTT